MLQVDDIQSIGNEVFLCNHIKSTRSSSTITQLSVLLYSLVRITAQALQVGVELHYYWLIASSNKLVFTNIRGSMTAQNERGWLVGNKSYLNTLPSGTTIVIGVMTLGCLALCIHRHEADKLLIAKKMSDVINHK